MVEKFPDNLSSLTHRQIMETKSSQKKYTITLGT